MSHFISAGLVVLAGGILLTGCSSSTGASQSHVTFYEVACGTPGSFRATIVPLAREGENGATNAPAPDAKAADNANPAPATTGSPAAASNDQPCLIAGLSRQRYYYTHPAFYGYAPSAFHPYASSAYGWPSFGYGFSTVGWGHTSGHGFGHHRGH